jgi:hypothetical protein
MLWQQQGCWQTLAQRQQQWPHHQLRRAATAKEEACGNTQRCNDVVAQQLLAELLVAKTGQQQWRWYQLCQQHQVAAGGLREHTEVRELLIAERVCVSRQRQRQRP